MADFGITQAEGEGPWKVIGRVYKDVLRVGATFTSIVRADGSSHRVELRIIRIEAYRRDLDAADEGLTALITVSGHGGEWMEDRSILRGA
jgi:hypothetical protein